MSICFQLKNERKSIILHTLKFPSFIKRYHRKRFVRHECSGCIRSIVVIQTDGKTANGVSLYVKTKNWNVRAE